MITLAFAHIEVRCHWILLNKGVIHLNLLFKGGSSCGVKVDQQGPWAEAGRAVRKKLCNNTDGMCWGVRAGWQ